jgi:hypothetical protein
LGRNDTYGFALTAQPDQSQGRPPTNAGSQPIEQQRPAHTVSPKSPCSGRSHRNARHHSRATETARGPPPAFIPGTNSIESLNYQLRKIIKNRGHFPSDAAAVKLLWLAIRNIEDKRSRERAKQAGRGKDRQSVPRLVEGATVTGWKAALGELALNYPDRINRYL